MAVAEEECLRLQERQRELLVGLGEQNLRLLRAQLESGGQASQISREVAAVGSKKLLEIGGCVELDESQRSASTACTERDLFTASVNPSDGLMPMVPRQVDALEASLGVPSTSKPALVATVHASELAAHAPVSPMPRPRSALAPTAPARPFHWRDLVYPRRQAPGAASGSAASRSMSWTSNLAFGLRDLRYFSRPATATTSSAARHRR